MRSLRPCVLALVLGLGAQPGCVEGWPQAQAQAPAPAGPASGRAALETSFTAFERFASDEGGTWVTGLSLDRAPQLEGSLDWGGRFTLPAGRTRGAAAVSGPFVYLLGGRDDTEAQADVFVLAVQPSGTVGGPETWLPTEPLPAPLQEHAAVAYLGHVYVSGGVEGSGVRTAQVWRAAIQSDGTLAPWEAAEALPDARGAHGMVATGGRLYVTGGRDAQGAFSASVRSARVHADGSLGAWEPEQDLPAATANHGTAVYGGHLYVASSAGNGQTEVHAARLGADGRLGAWRAGPPVAPLVRSFGLAAQRGRLMLVGGRDAAGLSVANSHHADLREDGSWSTWRQDLPLPEPREGMMLAAVSNRLLVLGGEQGGVVRGDGVSGTPNGVVRLTQARAGPPLTNANGDVNARTRMAGVSHDGHLFVTGGFDAVPRDDVRSAPLLPDGNLGPWTSRTPFPTARSRHAAFSHRGRLYVVGGLALTGALGDLQTALLLPGGVVGPWSKAGDLPLARYDHRVVVHGDQLYVLGGRSTNGDLLADVHRAKLNPDGTVGPFVAAGALPNGIPRAEAGAFVSGGALYYLGGCTEGACTQRCADVHLSHLGPDGGLGPWVAQPALPAEVRGVEAVVHDQWAFVVAPSTGAFATAVWGARLRPDGSPDSWLEVGNLTQARSDHLALVHGGRLYALGGYVSVGGAATGTVEVHGLDTGVGLEPSLSDTGLPSEMSGHVLVAHDGHLYALGGHDSTGQSLALVYSAKLGEDGAVGSWSRQADLPSACAHPAWALDGADLYLFGGEDASFAYTRTIYRSRLAGGVPGGWEKVGELPVPHAHGASTFANGHVYVLNGKTGPNPGELWFAPLGQGAVGSWTQTTPLPDARGDTVLVAHGGFLHALGGETPTGPTSDTWLASLQSDGSVGAWRQGAPLRTSRSDHRALVHGGYLWVVGGSDVGGVEVAPLRSNGLPGAFQWMSGLLSPRDALGAAVHGGWLYTVGGRSVPTDGATVDRVERARLRVPSSRGHAGLAVDLGALRPVLETLTVSSPSSPPGAVRLRYAAAAEDGRFGDAVDLGEVAVGTKVPVGSQNVRYLQLFVELDDTALHERGRRQATTTVVDGVRFDVSATPPARVRLSVDAHETAIHLPFPFRVSLEDAQGGRVAAAVPLEVTVQGTATCTATPRAPSTAQFSTGPTGLGEGTLLCTTPGEGVLCAAASGLEQDCVSLFVGLPEDAVALAFSLTPEDGGPVGARPELVAVVENTSRFASGPLRLPLQATRLRVKDAEPDAAGTVWLDVGPLAPGGRVELRVPLLVTPGEGPATLRARVRDVRDRAVSLEATVRFDVPTLGMDLGCGCGGGAGGAGPASLLWATALLLLLGRARRRT